MAIRSIQALSVKEAVNANVAVHTTSVTLTRPANTTQYTQNDFVNDATAPTTAIILPIGVAARPFGTIIGASLIKSTSTTLNATFDLYIVGKTVTSANGFADNAASDIAAAGGPGVFHKISFTCAAITGFTSYGEVKTGLSLPFETSVTNSAGLASVYAILLMSAATGYIPGSAETFTITLLYK